MVNHRFSGNHGGGECRAHQKMVADLVQRLEDGGRYNLIATNIEYKVGNKEGEIDVLTYRDGVYHFYEIKSGKTKLSKAREQYHRFVETHPELDVKGVYVGANGVKRLR